MMWQAGEWRGALRLLDVARDRQGQEEVDLSLLKAALDICIRQGRVSRPHRRNSFSPGDRKGGQAMRWQAL